MNDKELLTLAAKAAGIELMKNFMVPNTVARKKDGWLWAPLTDNNDALRLAVKLKIDITFDGFDEDSVLASWDTEGMMERYGDDPYAATRRCIVRAAAAIGESLDGNKDSRP
jgi:hypothetical protein